jgi:glutathione S-transferase
MCGPNLTGADILLSFGLIAAKGRSAMLSEAKYPLLMNYVTRLENEPGYLKAVEKIIAIDGSFKASF